MAWVSAARIGGVGVGHADQRLGEAHQHHAFLARQLVFLEERIEPAAARAPTTAPTVTTGPRTGDDSAGVGTLWSYK